MPFIHLLIYPQLCLLFCPYLFSEPVNLSSSTAQIAEMTMNKHTEMIQKEAVVTIWAI